MYHTGKGNGQGFTLCKTGLMSGVLDKGWSNRSKGVDNCMSVCVQKQNMRDPTETVFRL